MKQFFVICQETCDHCEEGLIPNPDMPDETILCPECNGQSTRNYHANLQEALEHLIGKFERI